MADAADAYTIAVTGYDDAYQPTGTKVTIPAVVGQPCTCRECRPGRSGGMLVLVEDAAEAVTSVDVQVGEPVRLGDRCG
jgi:hypothetical protein